MSDIKKKFIDILFEQENVAEQDERVLKPKSNADHIINVPKTETVAPRATDILYGKQSKSSSFIDYFADNKPKADKIEDQTENYELKQNVSPIFGLINDRSNKKKKSSVSEKEIKKAISNNLKDGEYTSIVISPIYGYDDAKANDARKSIEEKTVQEIKEELHEEVNEDLETLFEDDLPFDIPNDQTIEIAKEAIMESVEEMNNKIKIDPIAKESEIVPDKPDFGDVVIIHRDEELDREDVYQSDPVYEETPSDFDSDLYTVDENVFDEDDLSKDDFEEKFIEEINEDEVINDSQDVLTESDDKTNKENEEPYTQEITKEDVEKAFASLDDTQSFATNQMHLFDYDDLENDNDSDKDLFDEIIGEDK